MKVQFLFTFLLCSSVNMLGMLIAQPKNTEQLRQFMTQEKDWISKLEVKQEYIDALNARLAKFEKSVQQNNDPSTQEALYNKYVSTQSQVQVKVEMKKLTDHKDLVSDHVWQAVEDASDAAVQASNAAMKKTTKENIDLANDALHKYNALKTRTLEIMRSMQKAKKQLAKLEDLEKKLEEEGLATKSQKKESLDQRALEATLDSAIASLQTALRHKDIQLLASAEQDAQAVEAMHSAYKIMKTTRTFLRHYETTLSPNNALVLNELLRNLERSYHDSPVQVQVLQEAANGLAAHQKIQLMEIEMNGAHAFTDASARNRFISLAKEVAKTKDPKTAAKFDKDITQVEIEWTNTIRFITTHGSGDRQAIRDKHQELRTMQETLLRILQGKAHLPRTWSHPSTEDDHESIATTSHPVARKATKQDVEVKPTKESVSRSSIAQLARNGDASTLDRHLRKMAEPAKTKFMHFEMQGGHSFMTFAAAQGDTDVVHTLLKHGMDPTHTGSDGVTPIQAAQANGHHEVALLLHRHIQAQKPTTTATPDTGIALREVPRKEAFAAAKTMPVPSHNPALTVTPERRPAFQPGTTISHRSPLNNRSPHPGPTLQEHALHHRTALHVGPTDVQPVESAW